MREYSNTPVVTWYFCTQDTPILQTMAATSLNTVLQGAMGKLAIPYSPPKIPVMDRHHYSSSGGDYGGHSYGISHKKGSHSIALSALTLLAFLFFLNILQNCLQEHMDSMNPQVVVVTRVKAAREAEKRKGDDGILVNTTAVAGEGVDLVEDSVVESRLEEAVVGDDVKDEKVGSNKYFVKLVNRQPLDKEMDYVYLNDKKK